MIIFSRNPCTQNWSMAAYRHWKVIPSSAATSPSNNVWAQCICTNVRISSNDDTLSPTQHTYTHIQHQVYNNYWNTLYAHFRHHKWRTCKTIALFWLNLGWSAYRARYHSVGQQAFSRERQEAFWKSIVAALNSYIEFFSQTTTETYCQIVSLSVCIGVLFVLRIHS